MSSDETPKAPRRGVLGRHRRGNVEGGRPFKHEVWVSAEEEGELLALAAELGGVTVPRLLIESTLKAGTTGSPLEARAVLGELFPLHRLLAALSNNVNQMATVANTTGHVPAEFAATMAKVRETAERIDAAIDGLSS